MRRGATLVELMITLALVAIVAGVATLALARSDASPEDGAPPRLAALRLSALRSGRAATLVMPLGGILVSATAFPDGSVVADSGLRVDRLAGRWRDGVRDGGEGRHAP